MRAQVLLRQIEFDHFSLEIRQLQVNLILLSLKSLEVVFLNFKLCEGRVLQLIQILVADLKLQIEFFGLVELLENSRVGLRALLPLLTLFGLNFVEFLLSGLQI